MLKKEVRELVGALEKSAEEWPWKKKKLVTVSVTMEDDHAALVEAFGFDDPLKRGLLFVLLMSRSLRLTGEKALPKKSSTPARNKATRGRSGKTNRKGR